MANIIGTSVGLDSVIGRSVIKQKSLKTNSDREETTIVTHSADKSGCAHYRLIWPNIVLNSIKDYVINDCKRVVLHEDFYKNTDVIRIQRQVSNNQYEVFKFLRKVSDKYNIRLIYEIDDIPLYEDIPLYNRNRSSYANPDYRKNIINMMNMSDEVSVTTKFMRNYFIEKTNNKNITIVPNYMPRFWSDRYFDENKLKINFSKNKKKPRILYAGSASHYGSGSVEDDFTKLEEYVKKTVKEYQWVFFGGLPRNLIPLYKSGKIEFHNYAPVMKYSDVFDKLKVNISIAPLVKNNFNHAKSNIKLIESGAWGIPCVCQDNISTYEEALYKFDTASELDDQIKKLTKDSNIYMKAARKSKNIADRYWLEDNIDVWDEFYKYQFNSENRLLLNKLQ